MEMNFKTVAPLTKKSKGVKRSRTKGKIVYIAKRGYVFFTKDMTYDIKNQVIEANEEKHNDMLILYPHYENDKYNKKDQDIDSSKHTIEWSKVNTHSEYKLAILNKHWSLYYDGQLVYKFELNTDGTVTIIKTK